MFIWQYFIEKQRHFSPFWQPVYMKTHVKMETYESGHMWRPCQKCMCKQQKQILKWKWRLSVRWDWIVCTQRVKPKHSKTNQKGHMHAGQISYHHSDCEETLLHVYGIVTWSYSVSYFLHIIPYACKLLQFIPVSEGTVLGVFANCCRVNVV